MREPGWVARVWYQMRILGHTTDPYLLSPRLRRHSETNRKSLTYLNPLLSSIGISKGILGNLLIGPWEGWIGNLEKPGRTLKKRTSRVELQALHIKALFKPQPPAHWKSSLQLALTSGTCRIKKDEDRNEAKHSFSHLSLACVLALSGKAKNGPWVGLGLSRRKAITIVKK